MLNEYIRGCENSTLANVLPPSCTETSGKSRYIASVFCTETWVHSVQHCIAIHACFACMLKNFFFFSLNSTLFNNIYNAKSLTDYRKYLISVFLIVIPLWNSIDCNNVCG